MKKKPKPQYSVAMSQKDGCVVICRTNGAKVSVIGSLTRDESLGFADALYQWKARLEDHVPPGVELKGYPH